jgi:hypothetical protein
MRSFVVVRVSMVIVGSAMYAGAASSQQSGVGRSELRAQAIVASFNKSKHVVKEKRGVRKEKYLDVRSAPAVKSNPADYSGAYEASDARFSLELRIDTNGKVEGTGYDPLNDDSAVSRSFTLRNGRVSGALLTATKAYGDGSSEPLEGVFINKTIFESPTDKGTTTFGLGVVGKQFQMDGMTVDRLFYEPRR